MKRTVLDHDGDPAVVKAGKGYMHFVILRLESSHFEKPWCAHTYTPAQARRLAATLVAAADEAEAQR